eukprot:9469277-Pyramimonas_sp.AAC.1
MLLREAQTSNHRAGTNVAAEGPPPPEVWGPNAQVAEDGPVEAPPVEQGPGAGPEEALGEPPPPPPGLSRGPGESMGGHPAAEAGGSALRPIPEGDRLD